MDDILIGKAESLERCVRQIRLYRDMPSELPLEKDFLRLDAISANLQRAAELCLDMANHVVRRHKLGAPKESRESFTLLETSGRIDPETARKLRGMVGFRNVLVHEYQTVAMEVFLDVVHHRMDDLLAFSATLLREEGSRS